MNLLKGITPSHYGISKCVAHCVATQPRVATRCGSSQYPQFDPCLPQSLQQLSGRASDQIMEVRGFKSHLVLGFLLSLCVSQNLHNIMLLLFLFQYTPKISPSNRAFEKYKLLGLFSEFYSNLIVTRCVLSLGYFLSHCLHLGFYVREKEEKQVYSKYDDLHILHLGRVRLGSIQNKNNWNNAIKCLFGSYSHSGIPGFHSGYSCSQEQNSRNIFRNTFLFRNIPKQTRSQFLVCQWFSPVMKMSSPCLDGQSLLRVLRILQVLRLLLLKFYFKPFY